MTAQQQYTVDKLLKNLALLEEHAKDYTAQPSDFCVECMEKHLLTISGLAEEGIGFFGAQEGKWFGQIVQWADAQRVNLDAMDAQRAEKLVEAARDFRKKLVAGTSPCMVCREAAARHLPK